METNNSNPPFFLYLLSNKCAHKQWKKHGGEPRWSHFHRIPCGNFRGLFPNPFKWTFHLSASSSISAIPTVQPFLHHFLHNLAGSQGQNKCLREIWSTIIRSEQHSLLQGARRWSNSNTYARTMWNYEKLHKRSIMCVCMTKKLYKVAEKQTC